MLITTNGTLVRTRIDELRVMGRNTQGVRLIKLDEDDSLVSVERIEELKAKAYELGFSFVAACPFVRSSYKAGDYLDYLRDKGEQV